MKTANSKLTARRKLFALEYLKDLNATQAAIRAGYSAKTARAAGCRLLTNVYIQAEIQKANDQRFQKLDLDDQTILRRINNISDLDPRRMFDAKGNALDIPNFPEDVAKCISGFDFVTLYEGDGEQKHAFGQLRKIRFADRLKANELLGRHKKLFTDKVEHGLDDPTKNLLTEKLDLTKATDEQLREFAALSTGGDTGRGDK
jgi:phage terminase small subunit